MIWEKQRWYESRRLRVNEETDKSAILQIAYDDSVSFFGFISNFRNTLSLTFPGGKNDSDGDNKKNPPIICMTSFLEWFQAIWTPLCALHCKCFNGVCFHFHQVLLRNDPKNVLPKSVPLMFARKWQNDCKVLFKWVRDFHVGCVDVPTETKLFDALFLLLIFIWKSSAFIT